MVEYPVQRTNIEKYAEQYGKIKQIINVKCWSLGGLIIYYLLGVRELLIVETNNETKNVKDEINFYIKQIKTNDVNDVKLATLV